MGTDSAHCEWWCEGVGSRGAPVSDGCEGVRSGGAPVSGGVRVWGVGCAQLWSLVLPAQHHYHPTVVRYGQHLIAGAPSIGAGSLPPKLSQSSIQELLQNHSVEVEDPCINVPLPKPHPAEKLAKKVLFQSNAVIAVFVCTLRACRTSEYCLVKCSIYSYDIMVDLTACNHIAMR